MASARSSRFTHSSSSPSNSGACQSQGSYFASASAVMTRALPVVGVEQGDLRGRLSPARRRGDQVMCGVSAEKRASKARSVKSVALVWRILIEPHVDVASLRPAAAIDDDARGGQRGADARLADPVVDVRVARELGEPRLVPRRLGPPELAGALRVVLDVEDGRALGVESPLGAVAVARPLRDRAVNAVLACRRGRP